MLYFATQPDSLFTALVDAALTDARTWVDDSRRWRTWAHHAAEGFPNHEAPRTAVVKLHVAYQNPAVYRMSHFFWVTLYDILATYATRHNAHFSRRASVHVDAMPRIGSYRCGPIQIPGVVATYWWDLWCFPDAALDRSLVPPPAGHRVRGGPERYAPPADGLVEIAHPKWAANPDAAELKIPGLTVPQYPLFTAPALYGTW
jgi:hypothetical protein